MREGIVVYDKDKSVAKVDSRVTSQVAYLKQTSPSGEEIIFNVFDAYAHER
jgi:hypothetical protein